MSFDTAKLKHSTVGTRRQQKTLITVAAANMEGSVLRLFNKHTQGWQAFSVSCLQSCVL